MIHTIQADFYRLFRSKGFWITEFILFVLMLMGAVFGATGQLMAIQTEEPDIPIQGWDGVQALINASSQGSNLVFLCIVLACLVLGVDLIGKLYKNNLTVGVSRTEFFFASLLGFPLFPLFSMLVILILRYLLVIWSALSHFLCQCSFFQISKFCHICPCNFPMP